MVDRLTNYINPLKQQNSAETVRAVRLREHHPGLKRIIFPDEIYLATTDNLIVQDYPLNIDSNGFILPHNNYDNPDYEIIFLGGSTTECMYVTEDNRFPYLTGQLIEKKISKNIVSLNAGASGNSSIHSLEILLNKIIPMNPDYAVIMHAMNDYAMLAYDHTYWPIETTRSELITINDYFPKMPNETFVWHFKGLFKTSFPNIYQRIFLLKERILQTNQLVEPYDEWGGRRHMIKDRDFDYMQNEFRWALQMSISACKTHNIVPVLMTQANRYKEIPDDFIIEIMAPMLKAGITFETFKKEYDTFNEIIRDLAKTNNIPLIDLARLVPQEKEYMYDALHFNDNGSIFVANIISEKLINLISNSL